VARGGARVGGGIESDVAPCPDEVLKLWPVNRQKIGNVRNKEREVIEPIGVAAGA